MNNSSILSNSRRGHSSISGSLTIAASVCGLLASAVVALVALTVWRSPLVFFTALSGALLCIDPLRK